MRKSKGNKSLHTLSKHHCSTSSTHDKCIASLVIKFTKIFLLPSQTAYAVIYLTHTYGVPNVRKMVYPECTVHSLIINQWHGHTV